MKFVKVGLIQINEGEPFGKTDSPRVQGTPREGLVSPARARRVVLGAWKGATRERLETNP